MTTKPTATCPVCNGSGITTGHPCLNCGGQTMSGKATGRVPLRPDGTPCTHDYQGREAGRFWTAYTCRHCGDQFDIDSSD